jgi:hypothetical protein
MPTWPCSAAFLNNVSASASCSDRRARTVLRRLRPCGISAYPRPSTPGRVSKCPAGGRVPHCSGTTRPIWRCRRRAPDGTRRCRTSLSSGMYQPRCERQPKSSRSRKSSGNPCDAWWRHVNTFAVLLAPIQQLFERRRTKNRLQLGHWRCHRFCGPRLCHGLRPPAYSNSRANTH